MHEVRPPVALGRALRPRPQLSWPALRLLAAVLAGAALWPAAAQAEASLDAIAMSLEELSAVRILATPKFAEDAEHSPSAVSIVTAAESRSFGWRTLADVLRSLQGFSVTDDHTYAYVGVRGVSAPGDYRQRFQVLIDGMSVNENIYASTLVDSAFPLDLELVERIEVIRGPSASVYGGDSMFGVVNVVTRSLDGGEASLEAGSGRHRGGAGYPRRADGRRPRLPGVGERVCCRRAAPDVSRHRRRWLRRPGQRTAWRDRWPPVRPTAQQ